MDDENDIDKDDENEINDVDDIEDDNYIYKDHDIDKKEILIVTFILMTKLIYS